MTKKMLAKYHQIEIVDVLNSIIRAIIRELGVKTHPANDEFGLRDTRKLPYIFAIAQRQFRRAKSVAF